jgi:hypothetical protein
MSFPTRSLYLFFCPKCSAFPVLKSTMAMPWQGPEQGRWQLKPWLLLALAVMLTAPHVAGRQIAFVAPSASAVCLPPSSVSMMRPSARGCGCDSLPFPSLLRLYVLSFPLCRYVWPPSSFYLFSPPFPFLPPSFFLSAVAKQSDTLSLPWEKT